eukprot:978280-Alexandrium_andersonii.AAC.1
MAADCPRRAGRAAQRLERAVSPELPRSAFCAVLRAGSDGNDETRPKSQKCAEKVQFGAND